MTCLLKWNDLYMTNDSLNTSVTLHKKIHLIPIMFLRLKKMLFTEYQVYFCIRQYNAITRLTPLSSDSNKQNSIEFHHMCTAYLDHLGYCKVCLQSND